jgi:hypothetical protein
MEWTADGLLLVVYRGLALAVAIAMVVAILRTRDWRAQLYAALVLVPLALRAAGIK